ncbi:MAG TPA: thiolase domain-containing protein [Acidobacteriota bacterium]|nr:thiolase domain-containing protein [Acidobacteriota bacterium]
MRNVSIIGSGKTKFGVFPDRSLKSLIAEASKKAIQDAKIESSAIQAFYLGNFAATGFNNQNHVAPYAATAIGLKNHIPTVRTEAACASSGAALREATIAVASGLYDYVLVGGVEKMNTVETPRVTEYLAQAADWETEAKIGATFPSMFALMAQRHMHEFGTRREHISAVAVKNHANGAKNPDAHMQKEITLEKAMNSQVMVAEPLNLFDCSLITDGAAAVVVCASELAANHAEIPIEIIGHGQASDSFCMYMKEDITRFDATIAAAKRAYEMANVKPDDIDVVEVHDCFTIAEIIAIEDLGFCKKGYGGPFSYEGMTAIGGKIPVNTSGGLKSKGHPVGATGIAQVAELVLQLRGQAGPRQVQNAELALSHNLGGSGASCVVHILRRRA